MRCRRFRGVSEQRTRNENQRPRENGSLFISRAAKIENPVIHGLSLLRNEMETLVTQAKMYVSRRMLRTEIQCLIRYRYRFVLKEISIQYTSAVIQCWSMVSLV